MKAKYAVLGMVASFAVGAVAVQSLHAQTKPLAYGIAEIVVSNQEEYAKEFLPPVRKTIADAGGKFLAAGGKTVTLQGAPPPPRIVVIQWESLVDEKNVPVPWEDFKITPNANLLVLDTTKGALDAAPRVDLFTTSGLDLQSQKVDAYWRAHLSN
jgi:uncharacterized protein (DUF1330 family)